MDLRPVLFVIGLLLCILSASMVIPLLADLSQGHPDWKTFFICIVITAFFGGALVLSTSQETFSLTIRQTFFLTTLSWLVITSFSALPFYLSELNLSLTDSFFEAMSGITTTGATVITGLDEVPRGILLWRAILQWLGGIGVILMAMSVLPFLRVGGMQIFHTELSEYEKALPRIAVLASMVAIIYIALTLLCTGFYMLAGMSAFDGFAHALTTLSTGGFSTYDTSFSHYASPAAEIVCIIFMFLGGGAPFVLYVKLIAGDVSSFLRNSQVQAFAGILTFTILALFFYMVISQGMPVWEALRRTSFNAISVMTGTGYGSADFSLWGPFAISIFFFLMVVGGCAGSTTCGIKVFRFQILYAVITTQFKRLLLPHGVFVPYYNGRPIPEDVPLSVMSFFFVYALCFVVLSIALAFVGLDFLTATSGAISAISNVGPGLGPVIGPAGTYQPLPEIAKWLLSAGMLLGRLEIFTVLVFLSPYFWKY